MAQPRRAKKVDGNQPGIVKALKTIPGVTVEVDHDDILVGYRGRNYWYEIKHPDVVRNGKVWDSEITKTERTRQTTWNGHYEIVWNIDMILEDIGISK